MSYSLKNDEIYNETLNYIFSLDTNSKILNYNMISKLFIIFNVTAPTSMKYFEKYYGTNNLTKDILKLKDQSETFDENYIKNGFKIYSNGYELNIDNLYKDIKKINLNLNIDDFKKFINEIVFHNSKNSIDEFYNYILNLLKE